MSLPTRGVWIEIWCTGRSCWAPEGHSPHGECGLKSVNSAKPGTPQVTPHTGSVDWNWWRMRLCHLWPERHSPHGERGLKFPKQLTASNGVIVTPHMGSVDCGTLVRSVYFWSNCNVSRVSMAPSEIKVHCKLIKQTNNHFYGIHPYSYDEKPGIQAISTTGKDFNPTINCGTIKRDYDYSILAWFPC